MASWIYEVIGRWIVRLAWARYGRQVTMIGAVLGALTLAGIWAMAKRQPPEG